MLNVKHDWTLLVEGRKSAVIPWKWVAKWFLAKSHIEFERRGKLPGTSSKALVIYHKSKQWRNE